MMKQAVESSTSGSVTDPFTLEQLWGGWQDYCNSDPSAVYWPGISMYKPVITHSDYPVLVVAYDDTSRAALAASVEPFDVRAVPCSTFCEAEQYALRTACRGILVDLATMIKAKAEEKIVALYLDRVISRPARKDHGFNAGSHGNGR